MKTLPIAFLVLLALLQLSQTQQLQSDTIYKPFTQQEVIQVTSQSSQELIPDHRPPRHHPKKHHKEVRHPKAGEEEVFKAEEGKKSIKLDEEYVEELTDQEREERKRYNKVFKIGMIAGTAVLALILFKFCKAKRYRNRQRQPQSFPIHPQNQSHHHPHQNSYPVNPHAYPSPQIQVGRPYPQPEQPQVYTQPRVAHPRVHQNHIRPQPAENALECQIRFHENEILKLRQMRRQSDKIQEYEMQGVPINTIESFESHQPINRYRGVPLGRPVYPKDSNSSFASEYPQI